ncbi:APC family permease [Rhodohalobacter sp. 614A]|uniref:APC family permease n=1 Tax=Rhodohalobacter sp. 614A TaxID=2908649 RepID=UPI001F3AEE46|nr:APC family permease [Rhodohalobacter sp. 614A]
MSSEKKLSLFDACGMAIGGMIGGGIFAVLGEGVMTAGNATFISLGIGGILALITGVVYARLTTKFDESGGEFIFMEHIAGVRFAGTISWFLILGYVFTISLYAYTFGAYSGRLFGMESGPNFWLGGGIILLLTGLNLSGVKESGISEDILVYTKTAILIGLIALGFYTVQPDKIYPIANEGVGNMIKAGALVFVAYEGFQLLTYDYNTIEDHKKNLPRAITISIITVTLIYMLIAFVLTGSLAQDVIAEHKETVLAMLAQPVMGQLGIVIVLIAAVFSTSSAILATVFAISRLGKRIAKDGQLPHQLTDRQSSGVPVYFSLMLAALAILVQFFGNLEQITTFSSITFLFVFSIVNYMGYKHSVFNGWNRAVPLLGSFGCASAMLVLFYEMFVSNRQTFYLVLGIAVVLLLCREAYIWFHSKYKGKRD